MALAEATVGEVADLLRGAGDGSPRLCLLIGAGVSVTAGIALASQFVEIIQQRYSNLYNRACRECPDGKSPSYAQCMAALPPATQVNLVREAIAKSKINWAHIGIARLERQGILDTILTTNFDPLASRACALFNRFPAVYDLAGIRDDNDNRISFDKSYVDGSAIFHLHGQHTGFLLLNTEDKLNIQADRIRPVLDAVMRGKPVIISGYSGENDPLIGKIAELAPFNHGLYWVSYDAQDPAPNVCEKLLSLPDCRIIRNMPSDRLFMKLANELQLEPPKFLSRPFDHMISILETITPYPEVQDDGEYNIFETAKSLLKQASERQDEEWPTLSERAEAITQGRRDVISPSLRGIMHLGPSKTQKQVGDVADDDLAMAGDLPAARQRYEASLANALRLVAREPDNSGWQRELSVSYEKLGNLAMAVGDIAAARQRYKASLGIRERLAAHEVDNAEWQRDLSVSHEKLGNLAMAVGDIATARQHYKASLGIRERLAAHEADNAEWQRDLSVSQSKLGDIALAADDLAAARERFEASHAILERLAAQSGSAGQQRDLSVSHIRLGDIAMAAGDIAAARRHYQAGLGIAKRLAAQEPGHAEWQRDLGISHIKVGDLALRAGDIPAASRHLEACLAIAKRLAAQEPDNAGWQRDLSVSHERLGGLAMAAGDLAAAREHYEASLAIRERLAEQEPGDAGWQRDLFVSLATLAQLAEREGNRQGALDRFEQAERVMAALCERRPGHPDLAQVRDEINRLRN
jgi:tetratricopeptide (TPR) repeat protein